MEVRGLKNFQKYSDILPFYGCTSGYNQICIHWTEIQLYTEDAGLSGYNRKFFQIFFYSVVTRASLTGTDRYDLLSVVHAYEQCEVADSGPTKNTLV